MERREFVQGGRDSLKRVSPAFEFVKNGCNSAWFQALKLKVLLS